MASTPIGMAGEWRTRILDAGRRRVLITDLQGTAQEADLSKPPNCQGHGRIHHFRRWSQSGWISNPLPIDPACKALGLPRTDLLRAQVFQCAACNFCCWYCFVPPELLGGNPAHSSWFTSDQLLDLYLAQADPPHVIDLSGGNPELVPEWALWMIQAIKRRGLDSRIYLWADDNLSTDFLWRFLSDADREVLRSAQNYGRVGCFKGFDGKSFAFNTGVGASFFDGQFAAMRDLLQAGFNTYAYVTLTTPDLEGAGPSLARFVDRLQSLDANLPLRTIPLEIRPFAPTRARLNKTRRLALANQYAVVDRWRSEIERRFPYDLRTCSVADVPLTSGRTP